MTAFKPIREIKSYTMKIDALPATIFPLLCPVREYEWIEPWSCDMVFSESGVAENNAVFRTDFATQGGRETWVVCRYEKDRAIEFLRFVPDCKVNRLDVSLTAAGDSTILTWTHTYTGLSESGNQWIRRLTDDAFQSEKIPDRYGKKPHVPGPHRTGSGEPVARPLCDPDLCPPFPRGLLPGRHRKGRSRISLHGGKGGGACRCRQSGRSRGGSHRTGRR